MKKWYFLFVITLFLAIPCAARIIIVDANGTGDYPTIQAAINAANTGDIVELQPGTYTGTGNRDIRFWGKPITVRSIYPNDPNIVSSTIINCNGTKREPHRGFSFISAEGPESIVDGLTITNGYGPYEDFYYSTGGAIYCKGSSPTISNCIITSNVTAHYDQLGYGGGIDCSYNSNARIIHCTISNNVAELGGGIDCFSSSPTISRCVIKDNNANTHGGGGINFSGGRPIITNSIISGNHSYAGGGIYCDSTVATISHCTIVNNSTSKYGSGIDCSSSKATIGHCILWNNTGHGGIQVEMFKYSELALSYSDVQGGQSAVYVQPGCTMTYGADNINNDPCFVDQSMGDFHLSNLSLCINAGDPCYILTSGESDIDGEPRVMYGFVDIGADEVGVILEVLPKKFEFFTDENGPNPEAQILYVSNVGIGMLNWEIIYDCNWLTVTPTTGSSEGEVNEVILRVDATGMSRGNYYCELLVCGPCALNSPQTIGVILNVLGPPIINLPIKKLVFNAYEGRSNPNGQILTIFNGGGGTLNWHTNYYCNWLTLNPSSGSLTREEANDVLISVDITDLQRGIYNCILMISDPCAENNPQTVSVDLIIHGPIIKLSGTYFLFYGWEGFNAPEDQIFTIHNSGGGTLNWEIINDCNWLTVFPVTGSSTGEPNDVTLSVDTTGLPDDTYNCELIISDPCAENNPQIVTVVLTFDCYPRNQPDYYEWISVGKPECWCYPRQCLGDADGLPYGKNNYWVSIPDLAILKKAWNKNYYQMSGNEICADFDHLPYGKCGYRVSIPDLDILKANWNIPNGPAPTCLPGNRNP